MKDTLAQRQTAELVNCLCRRLDVENVSIKDIQGQMEKTILEDFLEQRSRMNYAVFTNFGSVNTIKKLFLLKLEYSYLVFGLTAGDDDDSTYQSLYSQRKGFITKETVKPNSNFFVLLGCIE